MRNYFIIFQERILTHRPPQTDCPRGIPSLVFGKDRRSIRLIRSKKVISSIEAIPHHPSKSHLSSLFFQRSNRRFTITGYRLIDSRRRHLSTYSVTYNGDIVSICHIVVHIAADRKIMFVGKHLIVGNTYIGRNIRRHVLVFRQFTEFFHRRSALTLLNRSGRY